MSQTPAHERTTRSDPQVPIPGNLNIDHCAHFVPHIDAASAALARLGFTITPFSAQSHRLKPDGPLVPAGTGNRCVMLHRGYLEFLTPTGDTPLAAQLRTAIARYTGVHLVAFGTADAVADHGRLAARGFHPQAPLALQREIGTEAGATATARFTIVRVPPGTMAEGRIQYCQHHTPALLWQTRWLAHANGAAALTGMLLCVADPQEAAERYARFTGIAARHDHGQWRIDTARGSLLFIDSQTAEHRFHRTPPALPWIAGYVLAADMRVARRHLEAAGASPTPLDADRFHVALPPELGGHIVFEPPSAAALNLVHNDR